MKKLVVLMAAFVFLALPPGTSPAAGALSSVAVDGVEFQLLDQAGYTVVPNSEYGKYSFARLVENLDKSDFSVLAVSINDAVGRQAKRGDHARKFKYAIFCAHKPLIHHTITERQFAELKEPFKVPVNKNDLAKVKKAFASPAAVADATINLGMFDESKRHAALLTLAPLNDGKYKFAACATVVLLNNGKTVYVYFHEAVESINEILQLKTEAADYARKYNMAYQSGKDEQNLSERLSHINKMAQDLTE